MVKERTNGFIDLCKILNIPNLNYLENEKAFELLHKILSSKEDIEIIKSESGECLLFSFCVRGQKYFFKYDASSLPENELFANEICVDLKIPCLKYNIAYLGSLRGVVSKKYKLSHAKYISGWEILSETHPDDGKKYDHIEDNDTKEYYKQSSLAKYNTLEEIWFALEKRYKDRPDKETLLIKLMGKIADMFILDLILGNTDRHPGNWTIVEYANGKVDLIPIYDNSRILDCDPDVTKLKMPLRREGNSLATKQFLLAENVENFVKESDRHFTDLLINSLWVLKENNVSRILYAIERSTGIEIQNYIKNAFIEKSRRQLHFLITYLGLHEILDVEFVDLKFLLDEDRQDRTRKNDIACSIITPTQTLHILRLDGTLWHHEDLYMNVLAKIYGVNIAIREDVITIDYVYKFKRAMIELPFYITRKQYEELYTAVRTIKKSGFEIYATIENYDPIRSSIDKTKRRKCFGPALDDDETDIDYLFEYLRKYNHIVDYVLPFEETILTPPSDKRLVL